MNKKNAGHKNHAHFENAKILDFDTKLLLQFHIESVKVLLSLNITLNVLFFSVLKCNLSLCWQR